LVTTTKDKQTEMKEKQGEGGVEELTFSSLSFNGVF